MRVFLVRLGYIYSGDKSVQLTERRNALSQTGVEIPVDAGDDELCSRPSFVVSADQLLTLMKLKQEPTIEHELTIGDSMDGIAQRMEKIVEKLERVPTGNSEYNEKCEVHMPGNALMTFNHTMLLQDACTDALQEAIDAGWRIICAQPMPDQRRPDYILGRFNPAHIPSGKGAIRSLAGAA